MKSSQSHETYRKKIMADTQSTAARNVHAQTGLLAALKEVRIGKGISVEAVAAALEVDPSVIEAIEDGRKELNLTELRYYAYSIGAVVEYDVVPADRG
jgi:DNA-binding XRE family transcriptional regulator